MTDDFETFLGRDNLLNRQAEDRAKRVLQARRDAARLQTEIPKVWENMRSGSDAELVDLVQKRVYEKVNLRLNKDQVAAVLRGDPVPPAIDGNGQSPNPPHPPGSGPTLVPGQAPSGFRLWGARRDVQTARAVLVGVAEALSLQHGDGFDQILTKKGLKHPWASRDRTDIPRASAKVGSSGICIDVNFSAADAIRRAVRLIEFFGHSASDLEVLYD